MALLTGNNLPLILSILISTLLLSWFQIVNFSMSHCSSTILISDTSKGREVLLPPPIQHRQKHPTTTAQLTAKVKLDLQNSVFNGPQREFPRWDYEKQPFPCLPKEEEWWTLPVQRNPTNTGLLFVKNMKTASSTVAGIVIRIARNRARRQEQKAILDSMQQNQQNERENVLHNNFITHHNNSDPMCKVRFDHTPAAVMRYGRRIKPQSFLLSFVRDPMHRAKSQFFHMEVSRDKKEPTVQNFRQMFREKPYMPNYMLRDMTMRPLPPLRRGFDFATIVQQVLNDYDFIGVVERFHESLVVLKLLLNLEMNDILYLSAKGQGGFDDGAYKGKCHYIFPTFMTPGMKRYFESKEWEDFNAGDTLLHQAANYSLDLTINALGRRKVEAEVQEFERALRKARDECLPQAVFPCSADGVGPRKEHTCLFLDSGCGYKCLDSLTL